jgi:1-acyl-sn-glycerol-3-phosphate acyltransferase
MTPHELAIADVSSEPSPAVAASPYPQTLSFRFIEAIVRGLAAYHRHSVIGMDHIPASGPGIVVTNHSLATYDSLLLAPQIADRLGRRLIGLVGRELLNTPGLGSIFSQFSTLGTRENAEALLRRGELILVMPGGMRESIRDANNKYRIDWAGRRGFAYLALKTGAPIILAACPRSDDIFHVYPNPLTPFIYRRLRLPAPLFRGAGPTVVPRPVKLTHVISEPVYPLEGPSAAASEASTVSEGDIDRLHARTVARMNTLMRAAL